MNDNSNACPPDSLGIVVIGRNESARLQKCLESVDRAAANVVYVDSGSSDSSVAIARRHGIRVIELDSSAPFSAARARNTGYQHLVHACPHLQYVQFVDADCQIGDNWLPFAIETLSRQPRLAVVAGWLHECHPELSIYNRLAELEWNGSGSGPVDSVGGIFMVRRQAFDSIGGFDPTVAAGEEPELCQRLASEGWQIVRLDRDMALHDLAMTRFGQWWQRMVRSGYGSMDVGRRFGISGFVRNNRQVHVWIAWLALAGSGCLMMGVGWLSAPAAAALVVVTILAAWPAQYLRVAARTWHQGQPPAVALAYAFFIMIAFLPQGVGQIFYFFDRLRNRSFRLVEYKSTDAAGEDGGR